MPSITFDLETVTPLFLAGADQTTAELRPPAFRGALRYWFRAIVGAYYWNYPHQLREKESEIFGDSGSHGSSKIIIRTIDHPEKLDLREVSMTPDRELRRNESGIGYLLFSMKMQNRKAIGVNTDVKFSLKFSTRPSPGKLEEQKKNLIIAANCFWLAVNLGGFGSRERRGAGSLRFCKPPVLNGIDKEQLPAFTLNYDDPGTLAIELKKRIQEARNNIFDCLNIERATLPDIERLPELEVFSKRTLRIYLMKEPFESWEDALDYLGKEYGNYRKEEIPENTAKAVFGLPLKGVDTNIRRSSPFRIKIIRANDDDYDDYYCLLTRVAAKFPKEFTKTRVNREAYKKIDDFIENLPDVERIFPK